MIQLSKNTIQTLKKFSEVNQCLKIPANSDTIKSRTPKRTLIANAVIDEEFPRDVFLGDVNEFLAIISIIDEPKLDLSKPNIIYISSADGTQTMRYIEADPLMVNGSVPEKDTILKSEDVTFTVSEDQFKKVLTVHSKLGMDYIGFSCDGENIYISTFQQHNGSGEETHNYKHKVGEFDTEFSMFWALDQQNVTVLKDEGDLTFTISQSQKFCSVSAQSTKTFVTSFHVKSSWGGV